MKNISGKLIILLFIMVILVSTASAEGPVWSRKSTWDVQNGKDCAVPALADLDNDGDYDLLIGVGYDAFGFENIGSSSSPIWTERPLSWEVFWGSAPAFADLDSDGDYDLLIGSYDRVIYACENKGGDPLWVLKADWNPPYNGRYRPVPALADLDSDGDYDLLIGDDPDLANEINCFAYKNTGSSSSPTWTRESAWDLNDLYVVGEMEVAPAFADLDSDGDYDLLIGAYDGVTYAYENTGSSSSPTWTRESAWDVNDVGGTAAPALADLDNDGDYDLLIGACDGVTYAFENTAPNPEPPNPEPIPEFSTIALPVAAVLGLLLVFSRHKRRKAE